MTIQEWLNNEDLPITIWEKKYRNGNENFEQWLDRISGNDDEVKAMIKEKKFIFAGRILSNRGVKDRKTRFQTVMLLPLQRTIWNLFLKLVLKWPEPLVMVAAVVWMLANCDHVVLW